MGFTTFLFALCWPGFTAADEPIDLVSGSSFRRALEQSISASFDNDNLRGIALGIERAQRVSIVLDRRLDPSSSRSLHVGGETLLGCLLRLAAESDAGVTVIGNTAYLGPRAMVSKLRTLVALRRQELFDKRGGIPDSRRTSLMGTIKFRWSDLDRPVDLLSRLAGEYGLTIDGLDQVPHDLWAGAVLPDVTAFEGLSLILAQLDLTFRWIDHGRGIRIEPVPLRVVIDKPYDPPKGMVAVTALNRWKEEIPDLEARAENGKIVVSGTEEVHDVVERVRRGGRAADKTTSREELKPKRLDQIRFSVKVLNKPASVVLKGLESPENGQLTFEYEPAVFTADGSNLEKQVSFELKNAKIEELLKATLDPVGMSFEIQGRTVRIRLAPKHDK